MLLLRIDNVYGLYRRTKLGISFALILSIIAFAPQAKAQSNLLESVKSNPNEAKSLCKEFRSFNSKGVSASSREVIQEVGKRRNLSVVDAEVLTIYVIGMHCPDVN